jgi:hypothetical protein
MGCHETELASVLDQQIPAGSRLWGPTRSGNRILPQLARIADENDREFFAVLDPAESATLRQLLGKLAEFHKIRAVSTD